MLCSDNIEHGGSGIVILKMGKKVREYKSGDFIFAKVKGYPAWPARVQRLNGKKYFVYFYGTGEIANLPPNMIFDYAENKDKFLTKTVKRRDFNDGVKQIEHDFANNVPLEQVVGLSIGESPNPNVTANDTTANDTLDETNADTTAADETVADETSNTLNNDTAVEDSDDTGALVIDEGKPKGRKSKAESVKTPAKPVKEPKTPRGKAKRDESREDDQDEKKEEELVSRSGRKIRPKRYIDEQTEDNATLPSPAPKKRRGASPPLEKEKDKTEKDKNIKHFNAVPQSELEDLKEPFKPDDPEKDNILIAYLPSGQYVGIKLFQSRPVNFKNESSKLQWDKQAATNAVTLKLQLERGQITSQSVLAQLVMDLNLTDEEKATLDKERETEEKKSRVQFLKTEMKLIELDAKIKTCLCLEKADTELCLKLLDEFMELEVKPLMLLKHPTCLETVKRMRAYVGNTPSWDLSEKDALEFSKQAHLIRKQADTLYKTMKDLFTVPDGLSFWEFFSARVVHFKKITAKLTSDELLEMVHEPLELSTPSPQSMQSAIEAANDEDTSVTEAIEENNVEKKKTTPTKPKKNKESNNATPKTLGKRQSSRNKHEDKEKETEKEKEKEIEKEKEKENDKENEKEPPKEAEPESEPQVESNKEVESSDKDSENVEPTVDSEDKEDDRMKVDEQNEKSEQVNDKVSDSDKNSKEVKEDKEQKDDKEKEKGKETTKDQKTKEDSGEPRAKRSRESKKTEAPSPRSPAKRKPKS